MISLHEILVSVIIPVYNVEKYLRRCLDSICNQTHVKLEIIIVDDGSQDACPAICDEYLQNDNRVIVIHQSNQGLYAARNSGIDASKGDWLCFVDSDDFVDQCFVEGLLESAVNNDCLTARCKRKITYLDTFDEKQPEKEFKVFDWFEYAAFLDNTPGYTLYSVCWGIYHKCLFRDIRFPGLRHTEDAPVSTQVLWLANKRKFAITNQTLYYYYQSPLSIRRGNTSLNVLSRYKAFDWIFDFWLDKNEPDMVDIYFKLYFTSLVLDYTNLYRDLATEWEKYSHLYTLIEQNAQKAQFLNLKVTIFPPAAQSIWETIEKSKDQFILYGFESRGHELLPWLIYFGVNLTEIWDKNAQKYEKSGNFDIPLIKPHTRHERKDNIVIIITIEDEKSSIIIRRDLRQMGYRNLITCENIFGAIKYAKYNKFLPFLLPNYEKEKLI